MNEVKWLQKLNRELIVGICDLFRFVGMHRKKLRLDRHLTSYRTVPGLRRPESTDLKGRRVLRFSSYG